MQERPPIPTDIKRRVLVEAGHRCAIPTCKQTPVEIAHIDPWKEEQEHKFENLIALCPTCHARYDNRKEIDRKSMFIYKNNLSILNSRYSYFERRLLEKMANDGVSEMQISKLHEIDIMYLVKDNHLVIKKKDSFLTINGLDMSDMHVILTESGKNLVRGIIEGADIG